MTNSLFLLVVSEVSGHDGLALRQKHHGRRHGGAELLSAGQLGSRVQSKRTREEEARDQTLYCPQGHISATHSGTPERELY